MSKRIMITIFLILLPCSFSFAADPFYINLLNEAKQLVISGKLDEALEDFKLAEFGLLDEKEFVPELFFYYALAQYKKGEVAESQALLDKMKAAMGGIGGDQLAKPKEIERDLSIMIRALDYMKQPGAKPGFLPFLNLFYEAWDLLKVKKFSEAETKVKLMSKIGGDKSRLYFIEGLLAFEKGDYKKCLSRLERMGLPLSSEFEEDASFCLAYSYLKRGKKTEGEKFTQKIKNPDHIHRIMDLMEELKAGQQGKGKK